MVQKNKKMYECSVNTWFILYLPNVWTIKINIYLDLEGDLLPDLECELDADLHPERAGELEAEELPDFDLDTDSDSLCDWERDLESDAERVLVRLLDLELLCEGERLLEQLCEGGWLLERDLLLECELLLDRDLLPKRDLERLRETLLDFDLDLCEPDRDLDGLLDLRLPESEWDLEL